MVENLTVQLGPETSNHIRIATSCATSAKNLLVHLHNEGPDIVDVRERLLPQPTEVMVSIPKDCHVVVQADENLVVEVRSSANARAIVRYGVYAL